MPSCCVPFCKSSSRKEKISFHQIPAEINRRFLWLKTIARKDPSNDTLWNPSQYSVVCQKHFKQDDYIQGTKRLVLKKDATPSIFPGYPDYLQPQGKAATVISFKTEAAENMFVELSNVPDSLKNDKSGHCEPITVTSSISKDAIKSISIQLSDVPKSLVNDKNMHCDPISVLSPSDLNLSILNLEKQNAALKKKEEVLMSNLSRAKKKIKTLKKRNKSLLEKNTDLVKINRKFSDFKKEAAEGIDHAIFIMDQIKSRKKKLLQWNPEVIKMCILWHRCSPSGYSFIQQSKFLKLPSLKTLKKYIEYGAAKADLLIDKKVLHKKR